MSKHLQGCHVVARLCVLSIALTSLAHSSSTFGDKEEARAASVRTMTDQEILSQIAENDASPMVRATAVKRLTNQFALVKIAQQDDSKDGVVREAAIGRMTDQDALAAIASGDQSYGKGINPEVFPRLRTIAVRRLVNQDVLAEVALEDVPADTTKDGSVKVNARILRMTAIERLTDQTLLAKVALEGMAGDARKAAAQKLTDPAMLLKLMQESQDPDLRDGAKPRLTKALFKAASDGNIATVQLLAKDIPLDSRDENGRTLLMQASKNGRAEVVKFLLDSGVEVNAENDIKEYVRMPDGTAAYATSALTASEIASQVPGAVIVPGRRETALSLATQNGHVEIKDLLVGAGAR
jgi:hypothetical protein